MKTYLSPAKINWFLHITGKRDDGYHALETVFQRIDWHDEVRIQPCDDHQITLTGDLSGVSIEKNLAYRAADMLKKYANNIELGAHIHLTKHIPTGAGLGGGSSNAATVLTALNVLWDLKLPSDALQRIGLNLGADVPFFISGYDAAFASGVGEILHPMDLPRRELLLVNPSVHIATADVFTHPKLVYDHSPLSMRTNEIAMALTNFAPLTLLTNDLEKITFLLSSEIQAVHQVLHTIAPHAWVRMSGSGATVFAAPYDEAEREKLEIWRMHCPEHWQARWVNTSVKNQ